MIILPAIDFYNQSCVRLVKGEYSTASKVAADPYTTVEHFLSCGATFLHTVDLNGAKDGASSPNRDIVYDIARRYSIDVEFGGGVRTMEDIDALVRGGIRRVILGSAATDTVFLKKAVSTYGDRIAVGIDCKNEFVAVSGWIETTSLKCVDFARTVEDLGVSTVIITDIATDGMLSGPNLELLSRVSDAVEMNVIASGGIKDIDDILALKKLGLYGAICGKSIYAGTLDLAQAIELCRED